MTTKRVQMKEIAKKTKSHLTNKDPLQNPDQNPDQSPDQKVLKEKENRVPLKLSHQKTSLKKEDHLKGLIKMMMIIDYSYWFIFYEKK